ARGRWLASLNPAWDYASAELKMLRAEHSGTTRSTQHAARSTWETSPLLVAAGALALLFAPRLAPMILVAVGVVGLLARGMLTRPARVLPLLVLAGFLALLVSGGKLFWPLLIGFFVLRAITGACRKSWTC
ncbi:MAG TPA: hypothetical protein VNL77_19920, partial [Roseiflexaceae bacterium]|nr:hypothetical protein [Roseiflexaceae bacterium]